jgi:hypothetical protein
MRHAVGRRAAEQDRFAVGVLDFVGGQVEVERTRLVAETRGNPAGQQVDVGDDAIAAMAVENNGSRCNGFHLGSGQD